MRDVTFDDYELPDHTMPVLHFTVELEDEHDQDRTFNLAFAPGIERDPNALVMVVDDVGEVGWIPTPDAVDVVDEMLTQNGYIAAITYQGIGWGDGAGTAYSLGGAGPGDVLGSAMGAPLPGLNDVDADYIERVPLDEDAIEALAELREHLT